MASVSIAANGDGARNPSGLEFIVADIDRGDGEADFDTFTDTIGYPYSCIGQKLCNPKRLIVAYYSHLWEPVLWLAEQLNKKMPQLLVFDGHHEYVVPHGL